MKSLSKISFYFAVILLLVFSGIDTAAQTVTSNLCIKVNKADVHVADLTYEILNNGNVQVTLKYTGKLNDNTYGDGSVGWHKEHKFRDLAKSDKAEFKFTDADNTTVLQFEFDYLEEGVSGYSSGYGPRIEKMVKGNENHILSLNTSLSRNLNERGYELFENSPETDENYSQNSTYPDWDFYMTYEVTVSADAFSAGFGGVEIVEIHNSPDKLGTTGAVSPYVCDLPETDGKIGDRVWLDFSTDGAATNCNGIQDDGEPGIAGVTVNLKDSDGKIVQSTTTDANGNYLFTIADLVTTEDDCGECDGKITKLTLRYDGDEEAEIEVRQRSKGHSTIRIFKDDIKAGEEFTFEGKDNKGTMSTEIELFIDEELNATIHTSCSVPIGPGLIAGDFTVIDGYSRNGGKLCSIKDEGVVDFCYTVEVDESTLPSGYSPTEAYKGSDDEKDSEKNPIEVCLSANKLSDMTIDFGFCKEEKPCSSSLGNLIWHDSDLDGFQDSDEEGLKNVAIELLDKDGKIIETTSSDENGKYEFTGLENGEYAVRVASSNFESGGVFEKKNDSKWYLTRKNKGGDDDKDSDGDTDNYTASVKINCADDYSVDFGFYHTCVKLEKTGPKTAEVGDEITYHFRVENCGDLRLNGGVTVYDEKINPDGDHKIWYSVVLPGEVYEFDKTYTVSDDDCGSLVNTAKAVGHPKLPSGKYLPNVEITDSWTVTVNCEAKGSLGDRVWLDENKNGIQDDGENGFGGISVSLYNCDGKFLKSTNTNPDGNYLFEELKPNKSYYVKFVIPQGYEFSKKNEGTDSGADSDADTQSGETECTTIESGENDLSWDAGISLSNASIGDYVWNDENEDGKQDIGESGVKDVTVELYDCSDNLKSSTSTDEDGYYIFKDLIPGSYYVKFIAPDGYNFSPINNTGNDGFDSDADETTGKTVCTELSPGEIDDSWDAGIYVPTPPPGADLRIEKTVDDDTPEDGDIVNYSVTVYNDGPSDAVNVKVTDVLPTGVIFQSASTAAGTYNESTGIWEVGNISNGSSANLSISAKVDIDFQSAESWDLGTAADYNVFVLYDINQPSSDTEGKMAVGRNAFFREYSHGYKLPDSHGTEDVLIVGGKLTYKSGRVYNGNIVYGKSTNLPIDSVGITEGTLRKGRPIKFGKERAYLKTLSRQLRKYPANGSVEIIYSGLVLTGTDPYLNVFNVKGEDLTNATSFSVSVPNGSVVLVNVSGRKISWSGGLSIAGTAIGNVLYNFYQAKKLEIVAIDVRGSILAPFAVVDFVSGVQNGQMIAGFITGTGQFNNTKFIGNIPVDQCVNNITEVFSADNEDPDSTPGDGNETEDDYSSAQFCVTYQGKVSGGTGDGGGEWELAGEFQQGEIVWSLTNDDDGNMYAGTWGGIIYHSTDGLTWNRINDSMDVDYIWSLDEFKGFVYAGTEKGIFRYDGETWIQISSLKKDVRAIFASNKKDEEGNLYAGTWGDGVYKSTDFGETWAQMINGMTGELAISSLAQNSRGDVYAGTMGSGVFVSLNGGLDWAQQDVGYRFIWSIGTTSDDKVFAGTYAGGLYTSGDYGSTWSLTDMPAGYVYAITVDANNNIYISTWESGVFVSKDKGATWNSLGMNGQGVSSLLVNFSNAGANLKSAMADDVMMYAGTNDGKIYRKVTTKVTSVENERPEIPTEYELFQNYPNPFNPETTIRFALPKQATVKLVIYDILGREVATLINSDMNPGIINFTWNGRNNYGARVSSGIYFYRIATPEFTKTKKMILMK